MACVLILVRVETERPLDPGKFDEIHFALDDSITSADLEWSEWRWGLPIDFFDQRTNLSLCAQAGGNRPQSTTIKPPHSPACGLFYCHCRPIL